MTQFDNNNDNGNNNDDNMEEIKKKRGGNRPLLPHPDEIRKTAWYEPREIGYLIGRSRETVRRLLDLPLEEGGLDCTVYVSNGRRRVRGSELLRWMEGTPPEVMNRIENKRK